MNSFTSDREISAIGTCDIIAFGFNRVLKMEPFVPSPVGTGDVFGKKNPKWRFYISQINHYNLILDLISYHSEYLY